LATKDEIRQAAEADLETFARLVNPHRVYGSVHQQLFRWWTRPEAKSNQLVLLPRDHCKSHCLAVRVAWEITRNPAITILYVSATSLLAEKQLYAIKNILTSKVYRRYWPEMVEAEEAKREKWTTTEISVDHPLRKQEGVRDSTIFAAGLTTNITGFHCDVAALDDVVVPGNVGTEEGRRKVAAMYSQLASIESANAREWVVGTRYDARDLYNTLLSMEEEIYDDNGEILEATAVYEVFERVVEDSPERNGTGEYLWPVQQRMDGKKFGFDARTLAMKRAKYVDIGQFYAQYYNDPNDEADAPIQLDWVNYYSKDLLEQKGGSWYIGERRLNVVAAMDFAFSTARAADFTVIAVVGADSDYNYYILDIVRFKTSSFRDMFDRLLEAHHRWDFQKVRCERSASQVAVIEQFKQYMSETGVFFSIDEYNPQGEGQKEERIFSILRPRYEQRKVYHYRGGNCQTLEDELRVKKPPHDDVKDAVASAIAFCKAPARRAFGQQDNKVIIASNRFGGLRYG